MIRRFLTVGGMAHLTKLDTGNMKSVTKPVQQRSDYAVGSPEMGRREAEKLSRQFANR